MEGPGTHPLLPSTGPQRKQEASEQSGLPGAATAQGPEELPLPRLTPRGPGGLGGWCLPLGLSPGPRSQQGGERGRMSNVLPISEEKVSRCEGPVAAGAGRDAAGCGAPPGRAGGGAGRGGGGGQRSRSPRGAPAGAGRAQGGGGRPTSAVPPHLSPAGQRGGGAGGAQERLTSELGVPSRQPRGQRAAAAAAAGRRVWPGERWRAGTETGSVISSRVSWLRSPRWEQEGETLRATGGRGESRAAASAQR